MCEEASMPKKVVAKDVHPWVDWVSDHFQLDNTQRGYVNPEVLTRACKLIKQKYGKLDNIPNGTEFHVVVGYLDYKETIDGSHGDTLIVSIRKPDSKGLDIVTRFLREKMAGPNSYKANYVLNLTDERVWNTEPGQFNLIRA